MNAQGLVDWCKSRLGQGYIYGAFFDRTITEKYIQDKAKQYPKQYTESYIKRSRKWIGKEAGDCVGLIKSYYWYDGSKVDYKYKDRADVSANGMHNMSTYKGLMSTMPDRAGIYVHKDGHIGIYIGGGQVIEAKGVDYGVIQSRLSDTKWTSWGEVPYIDYGGSNMELDLSVLKKMSPLMTGQQVEVFQVFSNFILGVKLEVDGQFGTKSEKAAKDVQKKLGLAVDGKVGPATWTAILQHIELMPDKYHTFIKDIDNYKNVIDSLNGKIDDCIADENFYKDSIAMLEDTVTDLNEKIENNGKHVLGRYAEYESAIEELNNKLYDMDLVVHEQERMLIENDYDIIEKDKKIEALHDDLKDHEKRINELYGRLKDCNTFAPDKDESEKEKVIPPDYTVRELLHMLIDKIFRREA